MGVKQTKFWFWVVAKLPHKIIYFCFMHVMAFAHTGKYGDTIVQELTGMEAIQRYGDHVGI